MAFDNKDKSPELEALNDGEYDGPFTPKQMRGLKLLTGTMGVMIIICVILLGIGLSRQSAKLADAPTQAKITLPAEMTILSITADGADGIWIHATQPSDDGTSHNSHETVTYYSASGKKGADLVIERQD